MKIPILFTICLGIAGTAAAADFTWTGATDGTWNTGTNWTGSVPVSANDTAVIFDNTTQLATANNIPGGLTLNSLTFAAGAGPRNVSGNTLTFDGTAPTIVNNATAGNVTISAPISLAQTVTVTGGPTLSAQLLFDSPFSGSGGLTFTGGFTTLRGSSNYTGATTVQNSGGIGVQGNNALGATSSVTVGLGTELQLIRVGPTTATNINKTLTLAGLLSSQSKKIDSGFGPVAGTIYSGAITLSGNATINAFGASGTGFNAAEFLVSGTINRAGSKLTVSTAGTNNTTAISGAISGAGDLELAPAGGTIALGAISGNGNVLFSGNAGSASLGSLAGDGNLTVAFAAPFGNVSISGVVSGNRNLSITNGSLSLGSASNTFTGTISLDGLSTLTIANQARLGNAANTVTMSNGALLSLTSDTTFSRAIAIPAGAGVIEINGQSRTISSNISGAGGFQLNNFSIQSIVTLSGSNTFQDGLTIGTGVIVVYASDSNLGQTGGRVILGGGSLSMPSGLGTFNRPLELTSLTTGGISGAAGQTYELSGNISGAGRLNLGGDTTYKLSGTNTQAGGVTLSGDVGAPTILEVGSDSQLGGSTGVFNIGRLNGSFVLPGTVRASADLTVAATRSTSFRSMTVDTNGHTVIFYQPITGRGMTKAGAGTWILNTANPDNTGTNGVVIEQGTLRIGVNDALGPRAEVQSIADNAVLDLAGFNLEVGSISNATTLSEIKLGTGTLTIRTGGSVDGAITGAGAVVLGKTGFSSSTAIFSGTNTFSGGLTIHEGARLVVQNPNSLGAAGNAITINNGSLGIGTLAASPLIIDASTNLTIGSGGARFSAEGQSIVIESQLTGTNPIRFSGGSQPGEPTKYDVRLSNPNNNFTGPVQLGRADSGDTANAIIGIVSNGSLGNTANVITMGASFFNGESTNAATGGLRAYADVVLPATRAIQLNGSTSDLSSSGGVFDTNGHTITIEGAITQLTAGMPLLKIGEGTLVLNGANTYTGTTTVSEGMLGGTGTVQNIVVDSAGTLAPGASAGLFTVNDSVEFFGGTLAMELGGTTRGSGYDALDVGNSLSLGGATLTLTLIGGFQSAILPTDTFVLANALALSGDFGNVISGNRLVTEDGFGSFLVSYGVGSPFDANSVVISDFAAVPEPHQWAWAIGAMLVVLAVRRHRAALA